MGNQLPCGTNLANFQGGMAPLRRRPLTPHHQHGAFGDVWAQVHKASWDSNGTECLSGAMPQGCNYLVSGIWRATHTRSQWDPNHSKHGGPQRATGFLSR